MWVSESAIAPWNSFSADAASGASDARYASKRSRAAKNRSASRSHSIGAESFQASAPCACVNAQSYRSPRCARIFSAVRSDPSPLNDAKLAGAPRTALPPRYATVATVCRRNARVSSMDVLPTYNAELAESAETVLLGPFSGFCVDRRLNAELLQVMIHVPVNQHAPGARRQLAKRRMLRPGVGGSRRTGARQQRLDVGDTVR